MSTEIAARLLISLVASIFIQQHGFAVIIGLHVNTGYLPVVAFQANLISPLIPGCYPIEISSG